jgi:glycerol-3-phosphate acyltransferase PlsY
MNTVLAALCLVPVYLLGAFPTGILVARMYGINLTEHGSGNVGATNVARVVGKKAGITTLLGDLLKGALGVGLVALFSDDLWWRAAASLTVVLGHCFSVPPVLKGGKGVATALGVVLMLCPWCALAAVGIFAAVFWRWRIVSLASVSAAVLLPIVALMLDVDNATTLGLALCALVVVFRHEQNLHRLVEGREPRFKAKSGA